MPLMEHEDQPVRPEVTPAVEAAGTRRRALGDALVALEAAASGPLVAGDWRRHVRHALDDLAEALVAHRAEVERAGGILEEVMERAPRLARDVAWFREDHERLVARVGELRRSLDDPARDPHRLREELTLFLADLVRHRQRGSDLVYEAYMVDIGGFD